MQTIGTIQRFKPAGGFECAAGAFPGLTFVSDLRLMRLDNPAILTGLSSRSFVGIPTGNVPPVENGKSLNIFRFHVAANLKPDCWQHQGGPMEANQAGFVAIS
jgi:hypothetical protein